MVINVVKVGSEAHQEALCFCSQWVQWVFSDGKCAALHRQLVPVYALPFPGRYSAQRLSISGAGIMQDLITKWPIPARCWPLLCALFSMGTWSVSLDTSTTQQLSLGWMLVYTCSLWGGLRVLGSQGLPSLCCRGCARGERLHSVYIIKTRHTHTNREAFRYRASLSDSIFGFLLFSLFFPLALTETLTHSLIHHSLAVPLKKSHFRSVRFWVKWQSSIVSPSSVSASLHVSGSLYFHFCFKIHTAN